MKTCLTCNMELAQYKEHEFDIIHPAPKIYCDEICEEMLRRYTPMFKKAIHRRALQRMQDIEEHDIIPTG